MAASSMFSTMASDKEVSKWHCVYPIYVNSKKKISDGRRVAKQFCCEDPTAVEILEICKFLKLPCILEPHKAYPRDFFQRGRVRVQITSEGTLVNPEIRNKLELLKFCGQNVPKLKARIQKQQQQQKSLSGGSGGKSKSRKKKKKH